MGRGGSQQTMKMAAVGVSVVGGPRRFSEEALKWDVRRTSEFRSPF